MSASKVSSVSASPLSVGKTLCRGSDRTLYAHRDKAISQRLTLLAAMADGRSIISRLAYCEDVSHNLRVLHRLGVVIKRGGNGDLHVDGVDFKNLAYEGKPLYCGNSATTARLITAALSGSRSRCVVTGNGSLRTRPMWWLVDGLRAMGGHVDYLERYGKLPVAVTGVRLHQARFNSPVDSAQAVSALSFAGLVAEGPLLVTRRTRARDHTERLLRFSGIRVDEHRKDVRVHPGRPRAFDLCVPRDPSGAAYLAALHLASPDADRWLHLPGLCVNERRIGFFRILRAMNTDVRLEYERGDSPEPIGSISVRGDSEFRGTVVAGREVVQSAIDELPLVAALATCAGTPTIIRDAGELRDKDTDRISATHALLRAFGANVDLRSDGFLVEPSTLRRPTKPIVLPPDHRIALAAFVMSILVGGHVSFIGADVTRTSNPDAVHDLARFVELGPS